jgi:zinc transporter, ZIP family
MVNPMKEALIYSAFTGLSTVIGSLILLIFPLTQKMIAGSLGISAGVMLTVSYVTLLPSAFPSGGFSQLCIGMMLAILIMVLLQMISFSKIKREADSSHFTRLGFFLILAMIAHNVPEGAVIGIGFGTEEHMGHTLALAMAIHNIPEGIGLAAPLLAANRHPFVVFVVSLFCGVTLPFGTWVGMNYLVHSPDVTTIGLIFAATMMIWIVVCEIFPEAFTLDKRNALIGFGVGALSMYIIDLFH